MTGTKTSNKIISRKCEVEIEPIPKGHGMKGVFVSFTMESEIPGNDDIQCRIETRERLMKFVRRNEKPVDTVLDWIAKGIEATAPKRMFIGVSQGTPYVSDISLIQWANRLNRLIICRKDRKRVKNYKKKRNPLKRRPAKPAGK